MKMRNLILKNIHDKSVSSDMIMKSYQWAIEHIDFDLFRRIYKVKKISKLKKSQKSFIQNILLEIIKTDSLPDKNKKYLEIMKEKCFNGK